MEKLSLILLKDFIFFARNFWGTINSPYITYRKFVSEKEGFGQSLFIFILVIVYFLFASLVRSRFGSPFLLTLELNKLLFFSLISFIVFSFLIYKIGMLFGGVGSFENVAVSWAYSLIPTLTWFFVTSLSFLILPPPRNMTVPGKLFSLLYIAFSIAVLFWKFILYYLTLRFSLKLDLFKIIAASFILAPFIAVYGIFMYRFGIFRIPFI